MPEVRANVTYCLSDWVTVRAALVGHGSRWSCSITSMSIEEGGRNLEINLPNLEKAIIEYYCGLKDQDCMTVAKSAAETEMERGA